MPVNTILEEITHTFIDKVKDEKVIEDSDVLEKFAMLFDNCEIPSVEQLKQALFDEELS